jgi:hypothetical protein
VLIAFLLAEWLLLTGKGALAEPLGFLGVFDQAGVFH